MDWLLFKNPAENSPLLVWEMNRRAFHCRYL